MLFVGDHRSGAHRDVVVVDEAGHRLAAERLPENLTGLYRMHELLAGHLPDGAVDRVTGMLALGVVAVGTAAAPGPWERCLTAAMYEVFVVGPDPATDNGAAELAEVVRLEHATRSALPVDDARSSAEIMLARTYQIRIWDRVRTVRDLREALQKYFPAALDAFSAEGIELDDPAARELLGRAPDPDRAARLSRSKITAALRRAGRPDPEATAERIQAVLRPAAPIVEGQVEDVYAGVASMQLRMLDVADEGVGELGEFVAQCFGLPVD